MNSKLHTDKSVEELLKDLESETVKERVPEDLHADELLRFIARYNLKSGVNPVNPKILYKLYCNFASEPLSQPALTTRLGLFLEYRNEKFYLNLAAMELGETLYQQLRAKKVDRSKSKPFKRHFELFLAEHRLKPGKFWIEGSSLYCLYDEWRYNSKKKVLIGMHDFVTFLSFYFQRKRLDKNHYWFGIDRDGIRDYLTDEKLQQIQTWSQKHHERKKVKNKKKHKEVPGTRPDSKSKKPSGTN